MVCEDVYSVSMSVRLVRSSRRSGSVRWRPLRFERREGSRAEMVAGRRRERFIWGARRLRKVESRRRVVFSLGERRRSCV